MAAETVVRMRRIGGQWEVSGRDRFPQVVPESVAYDFNEWGADTANWVMKRRPGDVQPDYAVFSDVEIEIGGVKVWDGRLKSTPGSTGAGIQTTLQAEGMQYHLDDDSYERQYVHTDLTAWKDVRSSLAADLTKYNTAWSVQTGDGAISIGYTGPANGAFPRGGVFLYFKGQRGVNKNIKITWEKDQWFATASAYFASAENAASLNTVGANQIVDLNSVSTSGTYQQSAISSPNQQLYFMIFCDTNAAQAADRYFRITSISVADDVNWFTVANGFSTLKASDIVRDAINRSTAFISTSKINNSTFNIPEYAPDEPRTPREAISAANAYEDFLAKVDLDRNLVFQAKPLIPSVFDGPTATFEELTGAEAEDSINKATVVGSGPDDQPIRVSRYSAQQSGVVLTPITSPGLTNPSFATDTSGWSIADPTNNPGTLTRDTTIFDSSPAALKVDPTGVSTTAAGAHTGTFQAGTAYVMTFKLRLESSGMDVILTWGQIGVDHVQLVIPSNTYLGSTWVALSMVWVPRLTYTSGTQFTVAVNDAKIAWVDTFVLATSQATLPDKRGFVKSKIYPVETKLTVDIAQRFADLALTEALRTPTRGTLGVPVGGWVMPTGEAIPPEHVGYAVGAMMRLRSEIDPDTGGLGRDVRIVGGSYSAAERKAQLRLDSTRGSFQALLARYALIVGNTLGPSIK